MDQATTLRSLVKTSDPRGGRSPRPPIRVIAITSGKGGVGKTNITANLAYILSRQKKRVLILDADMGLANMDLVLGLTPKYNLYHFLTGEKTLPEIIIDGPGGMKILPASSGIEEMAELTRGQKLSLLDEISALPDRPDFLFIDTAAGIAANVMYFNMAAKEIVVVTTTEPTAMTDAYAVMKVLHQNYAKKRFRLVVNMVKNSTEAQETAKRLRSATDHFLNIHLETLGYVSRDARLIEAIRLQKPLAELYPLSPASRCLQEIAEKLLADVPTEEDEGGSLQFFGESVIHHEHG